MAKDPKELALYKHRQWLGYLQPVGLVVVPAALCEAGAYLNDDVLTEHQRFLTHIKEQPIDGQSQPVIADLARLLVDVFGWRNEDLVAADDPRAADLEVVLSDYHETLRPTYAVAEDARSPTPTWHLLIQVLPAGTPLDQVVEADERHWQASPQARFERLLRKTGVPIGLLCNGTDLRLVYAPANESTGHLTFPVRAMVETAGRPVFAALLMLFSADRLFTLADKERLPALLAASRKYQNTVSTELARQVLAALFELLRGFQAADARRKGELLRDVLARDPDEVYAGLLTVLLRLVFLLYAEHRGLMSDDEVYLKNYSVGGLFERLRADAGRNPDTMDQRFGAWAQLLALFRLVHRGGGHGKFRLPARQGYLFDFAKKYAFLEGRADGEEFDPAQRLQLPLVADGVVYRVLQNLLILNGERLSYLSLDVEQIGSVYEAVMGFRLEKATGPAIAIKPVKAHGAPVTIDLEELLRVAGKDRGKWLKESTDQNVTGAALNALKAADTPEALVAALERKVARELTPNIAPRDAMVLQPSDERRRSGSHYTPRTLTGPIVRKALEPVLRNLASGGCQPPGPTPKQLLDLKICDPAMGSGAFLVEAGRQLGEALVAAWKVHGRTAALPPGETEELFALRTVAQRCLYGVDKNPLAVDLAKLTLWLATLAKDHPFTFLDHALRCGDSLVGLGVDEIRRFHWKPGHQQMLTGQERLVQRIEAATRCRQKILEADEFVPQRFKAEKLAEADDALGLVRFAGNLVIAAFFAGEKDRQREEQRETLLGQLTAFLNGELAMRPTAAERKLLAGPRGITPFHWPVEFPEVFRRGGEPGASTPGGFDCIVGNPPFAGKNTIIDGHLPGFLDWLKAIHPEAHGNADLVAHFYRRTFDLLRDGGSFGLIATNTIAQGDTRATGLRWICTHGGTIYAARKRLKWPGQAAVVVSVVHILKATGGRKPPEKTTSDIMVYSGGSHPPLASPFELDGKPVPRITAYLFHAGGHDNPAVLTANAGKSFIGSYVLGMGFTFDDTDKDGVASPLAEMHRLIEKDPRNGECIFPYIGGEEVNDSPTHAHHRYVINFGEMSEEEARRWPDLMRIVEERVKPERMKLGNDASAKPRKERWWLWGRYTPGLFAAIRGLERVLVISRIGQQGAFTFLSPGTVYSEQLVIVALPYYTAFCVLQSRVHEIWARFFGSSLEDRLRYTPSDCFETFPFSVEFVADPRLEAAGKEYYEFRAALMVRNNEGLTKTYNRFHDPNQQHGPDIQKLHELHAAMDRAILDAYGWTDLKPTCEFLLDYEEEEEEEEGGARRRKKPWRYRWPDDFRDEVLARLLELNKQRAAEEALAGPAEKTRPKKKGGRAGKRGGASAELF